MSSTRTNLGGLVLKLEALAKEARKVWEDAEEQIEEAKADARAAQETCMQLRKERDGLKALIRKELLVEVATAIAAGEQKEEFLAAVAAASVKDPAK